MRKNILVLAFSIFLIACGQRPVETEVRTRADVEDGTKAANAEQTPPEIQSVQTGTTIIADGQLVSARAPLPLSFSVSGKIEEIHIQPGDRVDGGQIVATLEDKGLIEAVTNAELQLDQAEITLAQAELALDELENWEPDAMVVTVAESNLAVAEANYESALQQDSASGNSLTSARVAVDQAQRSVADAQEAYDTAWDPAREWELGDPWRKQALEYERDATTRSLQVAQESLSVAQANYNLTFAGMSNNNALNAEASVASARQALDQAQTGPSESEISQARLQVKQASISLEQAEFALMQARGALNDIYLAAPWPGTILSVDSSPGARVSGGSPVMTLIETEKLEFLTSNLSERDLADVTPGQQAQITLKSYPSRMIGGRVSRVSPQASGTIGDAATFTVVIDLEATDLLLLAGMTGRVEIQPAVDDG